MKEYRFEMNGKKYGTLHNSCFICKHCEEEIVDWTGMPYIAFCGKKDIHEAYVLDCEDFEPAEDVEVHEK